MTLRCEDADPFIEAAAVGETVPDEVTAHVTSCAGCAARLAMARRIEAALAARAVVAPPATFTTGVIARLRRDRWRAEQVVDFGFNVAVAIGILIVVAGLVGVAWRAGVMQIGGEMSAILLTTMRGAATRAIADARLIVLVTLLLTTAIGLWWWAEEDAIG
jgi:anti-sigma factor RsiW